MRPIGRMPNPSDDAPEVGLYDPISGQWIAAMSFVSMPKLEAKIEQFKAFFEDHPGIGLRGTWRDKDGEMVFLRSMTCIREIDSTLQYFVLMVDGEECWIRAEGSPS